MSGAESSGTQAKRNRSRGIRRERWWVERLRPYCRAAYRVPMSGAGAMVGDVRTEEPDLIVDSKDTAAASYRLTREMLAKATGWGHGDKIGCLGLHFGGDRDGYLVFRAADIMPVLARSVAGDERTDTANGDRRTA